jgi:hypothetical protein
VNQFFTEQIAYIARSSTPSRKANAPLLDNTMLLFCSSMMTGNHNNDQLP